MASIIIAIFVSAILELVLEKFISGAGDIVSSAINLLMAVPVTKLATADIYRRLEGDRRGELRRICPACSRQEKRVHPRGYKWG